MTPLILSAVFSGLSLLVSWHDYGRSIVTAVCLVTLILQLALIVQAVRDRRGAERGDERCVEITR